jgi:hypothetical protein
MFLISLEPVSGLSRSASKENYTCPRRAVRMRCRGRKCALGISHTAPSRPIFTGFGVTLTFTNRKHPREMGSREVEDFLTHLAVDKHVSASTQNQALQALLFLYRQVLEIDLPWLENVTRARRPKRLPVVLTVAKVRSVLAGRFP